MTNDTTVLQGDLRELLTILGMGDHARPQSPHEVFQDALTVIRARLGPPPAPALRLSRREKARAIAEAAANRWDAFKDSDGIGWLAETILAFKTDEDERVIAWANRSVREVQDTALAEIDRVTKPRLMRDWRKTDGPVLWWRLHGPAGPPFCGTPTQEGWSARHTHWTPLPEIRQP